MGLGKVRVVKRRSLMGYYRSLCVTMCYYVLLCASGIINKDIVTHRNSSELIKFYFGYTEYTEYTGAFPQTPHNTHTPHTPQSPYRKALDKSLANRTLPSLKRYLLIQKNLPFATLF